MIRSIVILLSTWSLVLSTSAQEYFVLQATDDIFFPKRDRELRQGDKLAHSDVLKFSSADASAAVYSKQKGRFNIKGSQEAADNEWEVKVGNALEDVEKRLSMGLAVGFKQVKLFDVISAEKFLVIGEGMVSVNAGQHPLDAGHFFLIKVTSKDTSILKKVPIKGSTLVLNPAKVFESKYIPDADAVVELIYESNGSRETLGETGIRFVSNNQLMKDVTILMELTAAAKLDRDQTFNTTYQMFEAVYGAPDEWNLAKWLGKNFSWK